MNATPTYLAKKIARLEADVAALVAENVQLLTRMMRHTADAQRVTQLEAIGTFQRQRLLADAQRIDELEANDVATYAHGVNDERSKTPRRLHDLPCACTGPHTFPGSCTVLRDEVLAAVNAPVGNRTPQAGA